MSEKTAQFQQCQRLHVEKITEGAEKTLKITVERFDEGLGWYTAGALTLPLHQMPLLQQMLQEVCAAGCEDCAGADCPRKIIPFPTLASDTTTLVAQQKVD